VHEASSTQVENHGRVCTQVLFLRKEELGFFSLSRNSDRQAGVPSQYKPGWYIPPQKTPFAENRFLQAGKGAEKSRHCFMSEEEYAQVYAL
jgi:hypothetical protein